MAFIPLKEETVKKWISDNNWTWIEYDLGAAGERGGGPVLVQRLRCKVCCSEQSRVRALRNFSDSSVNRITGSALKKDNVKRDITQNN